MNIIEHIRQLLFDYSKQEFSLNIHDFRTIDVLLNVDPAKQNFGDLSTNIALILSKELKANPRVIAQKISENIKSNYIERLETAGPGFINIFLTQSCFEELAYNLFTEKSDF